MRADAEWLTTLIDQLERHPGADLEATAADSALDPADHHEALQVYQAAGLAALERRAEHDWYQVHAQFPDWSTAAGSERYLRATAPRVTSTRFAPPCPVAPVL